VKRREVLKRIADHADDVGAEWTFVRHGANHDVYRLNGIMVPMPRHNDVERWLAETVWRECEAVFGRSWWR